MYVPLIFAADCVFVRIFFPSFLLPLLSHNVPISSLRHRQYSLNIAGLFSHSPRRRKSPRKETKRFFIHFAEEGEPLFFLSHTIVNPSYSLPPFSLRHFYSSLNACQVRRMGLQSALSSKFAHGKLLIVNDLELPDYRTNPFYKNVRRFGWSNGVIVDDGSEKSLNLRIAANNIQIFNAVPQTALSVYNILKAKILIIPLSSLQYLSDRVHGRLPRQIKRKVILFFIPVSSSSLFSTFLTPSASFEVGRE